MKITVNGFKSIEQVDRFDLAPITMLAGINSSGKSSLIQALLLLKQTVESESKQTLQMDGPYVSADSLADLIYLKKKTNKLTIGFSFAAGELANASDYNKYSESSSGLQALDFVVTFTTNGVPHVYNVYCELTFENDEKQHISVDRLVKKGQYNVSFTTPNMLSRNFSERSDKRVLRYCNLEFTNFLPFFAESEVGENMRIYSLLVMKDLMTSLKSYLGSVNYIGPLRVEPVLAKSYSSLVFSNVGIQGENTRFILNERRDYMLPQYNETLMQATKRWICDNMGMADGIEVVKDSNKLYRTYITNKSGLKVDLCHMGFGVSQILPIVVQGLLTPVGGTLIVIDSDVHLHPKVQCALVDFFIEMKNHGRKVLVETHSDHLVTRLRRRVSEKKVNPAGDVNLCFVENVSGSSNYVSYSLSEQGVFTTLLPENFLDSLDEDYRAIVMAKMAKE